MIHESTQSAPSIAREAKGLTQGLKESLKKHEPWDREIEFQRANLRRQYLQLIFVFPYSKESKDADHSLWMTTSYFIITAYKQRIAAADAVAHQLGGDYNTSGRHHNHSKPSGVVEHRKLVHRFRQFLAEEEKFWTSLVVRVVRVFTLDEACPALAALGIATSDAVGLEAPSSASDRRSVFPVEDASSIPSPGQKEQKLVMLSKALVCLGDIARYREHYNESGGRPRAGKDFHDDAKAVTRGRGGRRGVTEQPPRPRNYTKAQECYERARLLVPYVGNACHQLAILASYQQDPFASVLQYYRAICIKHPYDTAASNLDNTLTRNLEGYRATLAKWETESNESPQSPKVKVERFKKSLVALHGLWRLSPTDAETRLPGHATSVMNTFSSLVAERVLPTDIIWKTIVLALGALWRFRILRDPNSKRNTKHVNATIEAHILSHILGLFSTLLQVGSVQLTDASSTPEPVVIATAGGGELQTDLAQNITAVFRRTLPALRMGSKWVRVHLGYLDDASSRLVEATDLPVLVIMEEFWNSYSTFSSLLGQIFPVEKLPKVTVPLEEDVDVSGFAPLKRAMLEPVTNSSTGLNHGQSQVHPNEEQLMRIADLLDDAMTISNFADSPFTFQNGKFIRRSSDSERRAITAKVETLGTLSENVSVDPDAPSFGLQDHVTDVRQFENSEIVENEVQSEVDDDNVTVSTRTEDDPVNLAMQAQLGSDDDDEMEEQILYPKQNIAPMTVSRSASTSFSTPSVHAKPLSPPKAITAEDLVNEMERQHGLSSRDSTHTRALAAGTQLSPRLLFASGSPSAPTSIWSTTMLDSAALSATNLRVTGYPGAQTRGRSPANLSIRQDQTTLTPTRSGYGHHHHPSQTLRYGGTWSQGSSTLGLSSSQSQSQQGHILSPSLASYVPQPPMVGTGTLYQAPSSYAFQSSQRHTLVEPPQRQLSNPNVIPQTLMSNHQPSPSHNTWSYSGVESLNGMGAPLGPFAISSSYAQSRLHQHAQASGRSAWAPS